MNEEEMNAIIRERMASETRQALRDMEQPPDRWDGSEHELEFCAWMRDDLTECPSIGLELAWVDPRRWWHPFLIIHGWQWKGNIGWLVKEED
jgi:hypothetical protein